MLEILLTALFFMGVPSPDVVLDCDDPGHCEKVELQYCSFSGGDLCCTWDYWQVAEDCPESVPSEGCEDVYAIRETYCLDAAGKDSPRWQYRESSEEEKDQKKYFNNNNDLQH